MKDFSKVYGPQLYKALDEWANNVYGVSDVAELPTWTRLAFVAGWIASGEGVMLDLTQEEKDDFMNEAIKMSRGSQPRELLQELEYLLAMSQLSSYGPESFREWLVGYLSERVSELKKEGE